MTVKTPPHHHPLHPTPPPPPPPLPRVSEKGRSGPSPEKTTFLVSCQMMLTWLGTTLRSSGQVISQRVSCSFLCPRELSLCIVGCQLLKTQQVAAYEERLHLEGRWAENSPVGVEMLPYFPTEVLTSDGETHRPQLGVFTQSWPLGSPSKWDTQEGMLQGDRLWPAHLLLPGHHSAMLALHGFSLRDPGQTTPKARARLSWGEEI